MISKPGPARNKASRRTGNAVPAEEKKIREPFPEALYTVCRTEDGAGDLPGSVPDPAQEEKA